MRITRSLPREPAELGEPQRLASARRAFRYAKRAVITLVTVAGVLAIAAGVLWFATPSAGEATQLAQQQAREQHIAYPGPPVPANFARALVATEDHRFYTEPGVDLIAVGRVIWGKIAGGGDQGGATIDQQLAKMLYTPGQAGFGAELKQVVLAVKLNLAYPKQQLLGLYAEVAYYGQHYTGLEAASCGYFGRPAADLTVAQGAMLAGVVNAPSADDPVSDPANARARLEHVIGRMVAVGYLSQAQAKQALSAPLGVVARSAAGC